MTKFLSFIAALFIFKNPLLSVCDLTMPEQPKPRPSATDWDVQIAQLIGECQALAQDIAKTDPCSAQYDKLIDALIAKIRLKNRLKKLAGRVTEG